MSHFQVPIDLTEDEIFNLPTGDEATEECSGLGWTFDISEASEESLFQTLPVDSDERVEDEVLEAVQQKGSNKGECSNSRVTRVTQTRKKRRPSVGRRRKKPKSWREFEMEKARIFAEREGALTTSTSRLHYLQSFLFPDSRLRHPFAPDLLQAAQPVDYCMFTPQTPSFADHEHVHVLATNMIVPTTLPEADCFIPTTTIDFSEELFAADGPHEPSPMLIHKDTPKLIFLKLDVQELEAILAAGSYSVYIH